MYLFFYLSIHESIYLFIYASIDLYMYICIKAFIYLYINHLILYLLLSLSTINLFIYLSTCLSLCVVIYNISTYLSKKLLYTLILKPNTQIDKTYTLNNKQ